MQNVGKRFSLVGIFGIALISAGCPNGPRVNECILTVDVEGFYDLIQTTPDLLQHVDKETFYHLLQNYVIADCADPDGKMFTKGLDEVDAFWLYSAQDRENVLLWARARCSQ